MKQKKCRMCGETKREGLVRDGGEFITLPRLIVVLGIY